MKTWLSRALCLGALLASTLCASAVLAQPRGNGTVSGPTEFVAVAGPQQEDVPGGTLLVAAYGIIWFLMALYVLRLGLLQGRLARDIERLEGALFEKPDAVKAAAAGNE